MDVLAFHLVWATYGTWLPGDARGWIIRKTTGIQPPDPTRERQAGERMAEDAVVLCAEQRATVEHTIRRCEIRGWTLHAVNVRSNHVHVVVTADRSASDVMDQLKAWCSRKLSDAAGLHTPVAKKAGRKRWFSEGGDKETIDTDEYLANAIQYVLDGQ